MGFLKKFTKQEISWMMYDWANSAHSVIVVTILPMEEPSVSILRTVCAAVKNIVTFYSSKNNTPCRPFGQRSVKLSSYFCGSLTEERLPPPGEAVRVAD